MASLTWIIFFALDLGVLFWATAVMFEPLRGWPPWFSITATALVVGLYTFFGGLTAVVMTDVVQMVIMFVGGAAVVVVGLCHAGGWGGLTDQIAAMGDAYQNHFKVILPADTQTPFPWTKDVYERFLKKDASNRHYLIVGQLTTVVLLIFGVLTSPLSKSFPGIYVAIQTFLSFFQGPVFSILLLGMFWPRATQWGGLVGLVGGISTSVSLYLFKGRLFTIEEPFLYISWWSFVVGVLLNVATSLLTKPHPEERLSGLVCRLPRDLKGSCEAPAG